MRTGKSIKYICLGFLTFGFISCGKMNQTYKKFVKDGLIIYSPQVDSLVALSGKNRVLLSGLISSRVVSYTVYWNNGRDSLVHNIQHTTSEGDSMDAIIKDLKEGTYFFEIITHDKYGHSSVPKSVKGEVYGDRYEQSLQNRRVDAIDPGTYQNTSLTSVTLNFTAPPDTVNIATKIDYSDSMGVARTAWLSPDSSTITLDSYKTGSKILYRSSYIPATGAIDTFYVASFDTVPTISVLCNKHSFKLTSLPGDGTFVIESPTSVNWLWDGSPSGWPGVVGSNDVVPFTFTVDLGKTYNRLAKFEEWGRSDYGGFNPIDMEVWGISDTTGASTILPASDPDWPNESVEKGWTLLGHLTRNDNGTSGYRINLIQNAPPVRFIRVRVLQLVSYSTPPTTMMSEISFWFNP